MATTFDPDNPPPHRMRSAQEPSDVADFLDDLYARRRFQTATNTAAVLLPLVTWLRQRGVDAVTATTADLQAYQYYLVSEYRTSAGTPLARSTVSMRIAVICGWYRWLAIQNRIVADPSRHLEVRYVKSRVVVRDPLSLQEAIALVQSQAGVVQAAKSGTHTHAEALRNLAAVCVGFATGRRIGGMTTLRVLDLDIARRELRVEREKGLTGRVLPIAGWATEVVGIYLREARPMLTRGHDTPWLFLNGYGDGPISRDALRWMLSELAQRTIRENPDLDELSGKRVTWHSLRVSFATLLFTNGCPIRSINELLLHRSLSTTARYTPVSLDEQHRVFRMAHPRP